MPFDPNDKIEHLLFRRFGGAVPKHEVDRDMLRGDSRYPVRSHGNPEVIKWHFLLLRGARRKPHTHDPDEHN